jgi:hypothetical protein
MGIRTDGRRQEFKSIRDAEVRTFLNRKLISKCLKGLPISSSWNFKYAYSV